jgi:peptidoglycan/xylan/chitin deacetylase (PgdA/CDA1 family)
MMQPPRTSYPPPRVLRWALRRARSRSPAILSYHGVSDASGSADPLDLMIPEEALRAQVRALVDAGFHFVTVSELADRVESGGPTSGLAALTFDDGLLNVSEPLTALATDGIPASVYPIVAWIGGRHPDVPEPTQARMLGREDLKALAEAGVEIGAHSMTHADLTTLSYADCLQELSESSRSLEEITGRPVRTFAYPYGRHNELVLKAARECGFRAALAEEDGGSELLALKREPIWRPHGWTVFVLKVAGMWTGLASSLPGRIVQSALKPFRG